MEVSGSAFIPPTFLGRQDGERATSGESRSQNYLVHKSCRIVSYRELKLEVHKEKIRYILQFSIIKTKMQARRLKLRMVFMVPRYCKSFCRSTILFHRFRSDIFDVKDAPRTGRPIFENVDKITKIIKLDRHVSDRSIAQELKMDHKTVLNHLRKV
ncbi:histonelysine Nmethyltransferase SETMARlike [Trichonephila clavipes]|nr:histonelysine Nmethyltransferase SETMARlike [Trichonephila clavipes]